MALGKNCRSLLASHPGYVASVQELRHQVLNFGDEEAHRYFHDLLQYVLLDHTTRQTPQNILELNKLPDC